jgi:protein-S-isoprenylcysteine O-methyltransferase Ste14
MCLVTGLWLFYRSHADLGLGWSISLQIREQHRLVTEGVYRRIRHPMYLAILSFALSNLLIIPNWVAGPSYLVPFVLVLAMRIGPEERMMLEQFRDRYEAYMRDTKRLLPGIW